MSLVLKWGEGYKWKQSDITRILVNTKEISTEKQWQICQVLLDSPHLFTVTTSATRAMWKIVYLCFS
jgi:hypothetical protein